MQAEAGMDRIARILGRTTSASVIFRTERHLQIAELTIKARQQTIVAAGEANTMESALRAALAHAEHQALRYRDRHLARKRLPKEEKVLSALPVVRPKARAPEPDLEALPDERKVGGLGLHLVRRLSTVAYSRRHDENHTTFFVARA